ncbi:MAG TPA: cyclomaltodextrinase N-terminal domain-containing protein, partial [Lacibacter sp.]|nr:cyclomaltodextrinase N-terminal domain-containing protein [Lacibacter sp.]
MQRILHSVTLFLFALLLQPLSGVFAGSFAEPDLYPSSWWVGMKNKNLQLMIHQENVGQYTTVTCTYPGVVLRKVNRFANPNYLILDLQLVAPKPGRMVIRLSGIGKAAQTISYELNARRSGNGKSFANGATSSDLMYLIMPDRFSNGDPSNDRVPGMRDQTLRRDTVFNRHGGDLKGVENKLDYLRDLGVTAIWLNPIWENDMPNRTEHGYAFTNHYKVDPRLGGNEAY